MGGIRIHDKGADMKLITVATDAGNGRIDALYRVFEASARNCIPVVEIKKLEIQYRPADNRNRALMINESFIAAAEAAVMGKEPVAVCDCDLMFLGDISPAFDSPFDIGITVRGGSMPYNTGLWFYNPTEKAESFVLKWVENAKALYTMRHTTKQAEHISRHGGIDQAALSDALDTEPATVKLFNCKEWNACQGDWASMVNPLVVHVKSQLRNAVFNPNLAVPPGCAQIVKLWRKYDRGNL